MTRFVNMIKQYLGTGIKHPLALSRGSIVVARDVDLVQQSITIILETPKGQRFFLPEFGSRLSELLFEPNDSVLADMLSYFIYEALGDWEKRIKVLGVKVNTDTAVATCNISYKILQSNEIESFIYPFYRKLKY